MKKKIVIFMPSIEDGGVEKNLFEVSNYLSKNNIISIGRFGEWEYFWSHQSLESGILKAKTI